MAVTSWQRSLASVALVLVLMSSVALAPNRGDALFQERTIATGTVDASRVQAAKWRQSTFTALAGGTASFRLEWTGSGALRFQITRTDGTVIGGDIGSGGSPKTASVPLTAGTSFRANVWSVSGIGTYRLTVTEDVPDVTPPSVPTGVVAASVTSGSVELVWQASTDDDAVDRYVVRRDGVVAGSVSTPGFVDSGLSAGTVYSYTVEAADRSGNVSVRSVALAVETEPPDTPDVVAPSVPGGVAVASVTSGSVELVWQASTDDDAVDRYVVRRDGVVVGSVPTPGFVDSGLSAGTVYSYTVEAVDRSENVSDPSDPVSVETGPPDRVPPSAPSDLRTTAVGLDNASITWDAATDDGGAVTYRIVVDQQPVGSTADLAFSLSALVPGATYTVAVVAVDAAGNESPPSAPLEITTRSSRPNIVIINTDDQRPDTLQHLPKIREWLIDGGTTFSNAYVSTPSCCPSRATLFSGRYVHNNLQFGQNTLGFDQNLTIQRWLREAGYFTGHSGKYLHWLPLSQVAPHWDRWTYFKGGYTDVWMRWDAVTLQPRGYSTTITFDRALGYLDDFESRDDERPFFLHLAPVAPHGPSTAEAKYAAASVPPFVTTPAHFETDRSDKPTWVRNITTSLLSAESTRTAMYRTLYSVDDQVDRLMLRLDALGELDNTLVIFTSDNGRFWGEHGLRSKFMPYTDSVRVPLAIRWPGHVAAGAVDDRWATHVDIAPTVLAAAGVSPTGVTFDGRDLFSGHERPLAFTEYYFDTANGNGIPTWAAIETEAYLYVEYYSTTRDRLTPTYREYYDKVSDPYLLTNLLGDRTTANDPDVTSLSATLASVKDCSGTACP